VLDGSPGRCLASFMTRLEVLDRVWTDQGESAGRLAQEQLLALPLQWVECRDPLLELADAWIAAAAWQEGATLLHKDPAFRGIALLPQEWLG